MEAANQPAPPPVQSESEKNLYNSSLASIFFRNFLAGVARALGGLILYLALIYVIGSLFTRIVLPEIRPLINTFQQLGELQTNSPSQQINPEAINQLLQQTQQNQ